MGQSRAFALAAAVALATALAVAQAGSAAAEEPAPVPAGTADDDAGASLMGRIASFKALAYDDPAKPMFDGLVHAETVSEAIEFGMGPEGVQNNLDVVPAFVDVSAHRIEISFARAPQAGWLVEATFNGYVLAFEPDCLVIDKATIDREWSTLTVDLDDLIYEGRTFRINLSGRYYDATSRIGIELHVEDCPMT